MYVNLHQTDNVLLCVSQGTVIPCIKGLLWVFVFSLGNSDLIFIFKSFSLVMILQHYTHITGYYLPCI